MKQGANAKAKANAAQCIQAIIQIAEEKKFLTNQKDKYLHRAGNGWYYYKSQFAIPVFDNGFKTKDYNIYNVRLVVNHASNGKKYLYDIVDIKKKQVTHSRTMNDKW